MTTKVYKPYNARRRPSSIAPEIEYEACMSRYLITPDAVIFKVRAAHNADFSRWIRAVVSFEQPYIQTMIGGLDYASSVDRWYILNQLLEHKVALPLFSTFDQAQAILDARK